MKTKNWFKSKLQSFKDDFEFRLETLILDLTEKICTRMDQKKISRTKLARLLEVTPAAVTKILNGNSNFTLKTLLSIADALESEIKIDFEEKQPYYSAISWKTFSVSSVASESKPIKTTAVTSVDALSALEMPEYLEETTLADAA
jgi:transcriptional regulator with XRE-family HTH domain